MTAFLYLLNVICSAGQSALGKQYALKGGKALFFNINKALSGFLVFLLFGMLSGISFHTHTCLFGAGYGISLCISMYAGFKALYLGPMALTSIIASFSLVIPFLFGITVWGEGISLWGIIGILFLIAAVILLNFKKEENGVSAKWLFYCLLTFLSNGICSLIQKYHQLYFPGRYRTEFMLCALLCVLLILSFTLILKRDKKERLEFSASGLICGVMNGGANYIVLFLAAKEKASVLFPIVSVANIIAVWMIGRIIFKEQLKLRQIFGLISGIAAILFLNL